MRSIRYLIIMLVAFYLAGCAEMTPRQRSTAAGGAIGAGGGALIGGLSGGRPAVGAVLGGAAGALTGYILGDQTGPRHDRRGW